MRIAFFDSGIGGLTVLKQAVAALPNEDYIYYADTRNAPYGVRPKEKVRACVLAAAEFLADQRIDALVVACNTATSVAIGDLRGRYAFPIIGMEPAVKPALARNAGGKVLVFATSLTLRESKLDTLLNSLDKMRKVERRELDGLVSFAEAFAFDTPLVRDYLRGKLGAIDWASYETVVLGCTHFIFYRALIQELVGHRIHVIDGHAGTVNRLVSLVGDRRAVAPRAAPSIAFFSSGTPDTPTRVAQFTALLDRDAY